MMLRTLKIGSFLLLGGLIGCGKSEPTNPTTPANTSAMTANSEGMKPEDYCAEFVKDRTSAKTKFQGKEVTLTGKVQGFELTGEEEAQIILGNDSLNTVMCITAEKQPWASFSPGQLITVKGKQSAEVTDPQLMECSISPSQPNPAMKVAAKTLVEEYVANPAEFQDKYASKWLAIEGELIAVEKDLGVILILKGTESLPISCSVLVDFQKAAATLTPGQTVKLLTVCQEQRSPDRLHFNSCWLITK